jgi:predicted Zn-dependent protease
VHDTASAARAGTTSTGHASVPARLAPRPDHLVLVGGGAADHRELAAPIARGLYIPALARAAERGSGEPAFRTLGAFVIEDGELGPPARDLRVTFDPFDVLAATEALTGRQRLVPGTTASARLLGATVCPALRASGGLRVLRLA